MEWVRTLQSSTTRSSTVRLLSDMQPIFELPPLASNPNSFAFVLPEWREKWRYGLHGLREWTNLGTREFRLGGVSTVYHVWLAESMKHGDNIHNTFMSRRTILLSETDC